MSEIRRRDARGPALLLVALLCLVAAAVGGCSQELRRFPLAEPMWHDDDMRPFAATPEEYWGPLNWDTADKHFFYPFARMWLFEPDTRAVNVNALDEVPDSSWFVNRIGHVPLTAQDIARGPCTADDLLTGRERWTVVGAKTEGAVPGFMMETEDGRRYLIKVDGSSQPERGTAADVIVSRMYWAAGYHVPCNQIVLFDPSIITISPDAEVETLDGDERPMTQDDLAVIWARTHRLRDGRLRASASRFLPGKPLGPWQYHDTRDDDPNDVIEHQHRRELRGMYPLAAWVDHWDSRDRNTLSMFVQPAGQTDASGAAGYVRHNMIDFADSFGTLMADDARSKRLGYANYFDISQVFVDFITIGLVRRPWDDMHYGRSGAVFGYYGVEKFVADEWKPGLPNPAFDEMQEGDAAWMARKLALFDDEVIDALVAEARFDAPDLADELTRILRGRRDKILERWLVDTSLSPLTAPTVRASQVGAAELCLEDRAVMGGVVMASARTYLAETYGHDMQSLPRPDVRVQDDPGRLCLELPVQRDATVGDPRYLVVDVVAASAGQTPHQPLEVHLYQVGARFKVVGVERPED